METVVSTEKHSGATSAQTTQEKINKAGSSEHIGSQLAPEWLSVPDDLNAVNESMWASTVSRNVEGQLEVDGVDVIELAQQYGTPAYVISEADFRARARTFKDAFNEAFESLCGGVDVYYAGKSFLCVEVARWVIDEGLRLDTCSGGELAIAEGAGIAGSNLSLHGNNKSDAEIMRALSLKVGRIVVDSLPELDRVAALAFESGNCAKILLRLTPGVQAHTHEFIATAHEDQKFGLSMVPSQDGGLSPAETAVNFAADHPNIELLGLHAHIGSQIFEADGFGVAAQRLLHFISDIHARYGISLPELDLGGGYGIAYTPADTPRHAREIARYMADVVAKTCAELELTVPRISIEPGRAIVGPSTFTLYEVGTIKTVEVDRDGITHPRRYVAVDGGMSDNPRPVLYGAEYSAVVASRRSEAAPALTRVVGKHCESGDIVVRDVYLPKDLERKDLLAVPGTGAYCWALGSNYNYLPRPPVVAVSSGQSRLIVRGENEADLLSRDMGIISTPR